MAGQNRTGEHEVLELGALVVAQPRAATPLGAVVPSGQSFRIVSRTTASRSACRSRPESRAASARLFPSSAGAMAYIREAARGSVSRRAKARSSPALRSVRISNPATIGSSLPDQGRESPSQPQGTSPTTQVRRPAVSQGTSPTSQVRRSAV